MHSCGDDVTEIEVKPNGSRWAKSDDDRKSLGELGHWHLPDGTLCAPIEVESKNQAYIKKNPTKRTSSQSLVMSLKYHPSSRTWEIFLNGVMIPAIVVQAKRRHS